MPETQETTGKADRHAKSVWGTVTSTGGEKTCRVDVNTLVKHPQYGKYVRRRTRLLVHDPNNEAQLGDMVEISPCRPISKRKSWRLVRVIRRLGQATHTTASE